MGTPVTTPAILLRSVAYGESDRVVTLLGRATGRVSALARGARKSVKRFGGALGLGLGATGEATLRDRAGAELMALERFEATDARVGLGTDIARTAHAAYAVELCDKLCAQRQPEPAVFDWLDELLGRVERQGATSERLRVFELGLLRRLGVGLELRGCTACGRADLGDETTRWHPERGGVVCSDCVRTGALLTAATRRALERFGSVTLGEADAPNAPPPDRDLNAACRRAILEALRVYIPGPLRSLEFIDKMAMASGAGGGR